jgi:hypothetical protein
MFSHHENLKDDLGLSEYAEPVQQNWFGGLKLSDKWQLSNAYAETDNRQVRDSSPKSTHAKPTAHEIKESKRLEEMYEEAEYLAQLEAKRNQLPRRSIPKKASDDLKALKDFFGLGDRSSEPAPLSQNQPFPDNSTFWSDEYDDEEDWESELNQKKPTQKRNMGPKKQGIPQTETRSEAPIPTIWTP